MTMSTAYRRVRIVVDWGCGLKGQGLVCVSSARRDTDGVLRDGDGSRQGQRAFFYASALRFAKTRSLRLNTYPSWRFTAFAASPAKPGSSAPAARRSPRRFAVVRSHCCRLVLPGVTRGRSGRRPERASNETIKKHFLGLVRRVHGGPCPTSPSVLVALPCVSSQKHI